MPSREDILREMERIKATPSYQRTQAEHERKLAELRKPIDPKKVKPKRIGRTLSGEDVYAPVLGPDAAKIEALLRRHVAVCAWCGATFQYKGVMVHRKAVRDEFGNIIEPAVLGPKGIVDFDGKPYHPQCFAKMDRLRGTEKHDGEPDQDAGRLEGAGVPEVGAGGGASEPPLLAEPDGAGLRQLPGRPEVSGDHPSAERVARSAKGVRGDMSHDNDYCKKQILDNLLHGTIIGVVETPPDDFGDEFFGLQVQTTKGVKYLWIQSDAEGNGPGWVEVEDAKKEGT